jgi:hypothetical protein
LSFVRFSLLLSISSTLLPASAKAGEYSVASDKHMALHELSAPQRAACRHALHARYDSGYQLVSEISLHETFSAIAYDTLYWKQSGRGLVFAGKLRDGARDREATLLCYFAVGHQSLSFQGAYVLPFAASGQLVTSQADAAEVKGS